MKRHVRPLAFLLLVACGHALPESSHAASGQAAPYPAVSPWSTGPKVITDSLLRTLTVREKVGQLIMPWLIGAYEPLDGDAFDSAAAWVEHHGVGGIIISIGSPLDAAAKLNALQQRAEIPLIVAADLEYGAGMRMIGATAFPQPMAIGATGRELDAYQLGRITAIEARAVGIHWTFSPVADVNNNPANPIINTRSFGESPHDVAGLLGAYIRGASDHGLYTTAKHFPGHGDTGVDSHIDLPVLEACWRRLNSLELVPFRAAVTAGVTAVMTAHIALPCLDDNGTPATLSSRVMTEILRDSLGFKGIVVTDALTMGAVVRRYGAGGSAVEAFLAGSDMLLMPTDIPAAIDAMVAAVDSARISRARLDSSVARVLRLKEHAGLFQRRGVSLDSIPAIVGSRAHQLIADDVAARALTLVQEGPIQQFRDRPEQTAVITYAEETNLSIGNELIRTMRRLGRTIEPFRLYPASGPMSYDSAQIVIRRARRTVFAVSVRPIAGRGHVDLPEALAQLIATTDNQVPTVLALIGCAALACSAGTAPSPPGPAGPETRAPADPATLPTRPSFAPSLAVDSLVAIDRFLDARVAEGAFPGGVLIIGTSGGVVHTATYGTYGQDDPRPVTDTTLYDLASLTKVVGLTTLAYLLIDEGRLHLDDRVQTYLPDFTGAHKDLVTVRHLLTHSSGLPAWIPLYRETKNREEALERALRAELEHLPGSTYVYSDIGAITMMMIIERVTGRPFDQDLEERVFRPLGMRDTRFLPDSSLFDRIAPTELDPWRGRVVLGEVHDENAYHLGGVSGHAGLFSTGPDLARFAMWLLRAHHGMLADSTEPYLPADLVRQLTSVQPGPEGSTRAIGWDTPTPGGGLSSGTRLSPASFGHTGFTGTSIWIDPERDLFIILLTNRVHPTRENRALLPIRGQVADLAVGAVR